MALRELGYTEMYVISFLYLTVLRSVRVTSFVFNSDSLREPLISAYHSIDPTFDAEIFSEAKIHNSQAGHRCINRNLVGSVLKPEHYTCFYTFFSLVYSIIGYDE